MRDDRGEERESTPPPEHAPEKVRAAHAFCEGLLERFGARVRVESRESAEAIAISLKPEEGNQVELASALVEAMQYLANRVANPGSDARKWVNLEVGGFSEDADPVVKGMAERLAAAAQRTGKTLAIAPMSARERRQIHLALRDMAGVRSHSEGEGLFRTLLIEPSER